MKLSIIALPFSEIILGQSVKFLFTISNFMNIEILNITSVIGTYGFNLFCISLFASTSFITVCLNYAMGINFATSIFGLVGVLILYGVLHIGGDKKGWTQLE